MAQEAIINVRVEGTGNGKQLIGELEKELQQTSAAALSVKEQIAAVEDEVRNLSKETAQSKAAENFEKLNKIMKALKIE